MPGTAVRLGLVGPGLSNVLPTLVAFLILNRSYGSHVSK